jgi:hypothetical protein
MLKTFSNLRTDMVRTLTDKQKTCQSELVELGAIVLNTAFGKLIEKSRQAG